ncbi:hypothetical protein HD806DRAFT_531533 [Xylariaceae sp. AK1471]|nr:hypothetical protein HD806DRAFT_531533 [Xylariaceae sp. AK1471]
MRCALFIILAAATGALAIPFASPDNHSVIDYTLNDLTADDHFIYPDNDPETNVRYPSVHKERPRVTGRSMIYTGRGRGDQESKGQPERHLGL